LSDLSEFQKAILEEILEDNNALVVMAKGLGVHMMLEYLIRLHVSSRANLVFILNGTYLMERIRPMLTEWGTLVPQVLTTEYSTQERVALYRRGGVFMVTSRILVVDMLIGRAVPSMISGFLVNDAHRCVHTSLPLSPLLPPLPSLIRAR